MISCMVCFTTCFFTYTVLSLRSFICFIIVVFQLFACDYVVFSLFFVLRLFCLGSRDGST